MMNFLKECDQHVSTLKLLKIVLLLFSAEPAKMSSIKDLPKIDNSLKGELLSPHHLKQTEVWPSPIMINHDITAFITLRFDCPNQCFTMP